MQQHLKPKLNGLDHLRALAIILVFFFHYSIVSGGQPKWLPNVAAFGWIGVDLFFVLSGFLIASQLFEQLKNGMPISFKKFFLKRFFRIVPAFLATVVIYFCIPYFREKEALPPLWKFLTFTQNIGLNIKDYGTFSHCWSLCVEEHFYLLLPLILIVLQITKGLSKAYFILGALFIFGFLIRAYSYNNFYLPYIEEDDGWMHWYKFIYYPTYSRLDGLLVGVSIAGMYQYLPKLWAKVAKFGNLFIGIGLLVLTGAYFLCENQMTYNASVYGFPIVAIGFGCLVIGAISSTSFLFKWHSNATAFMATVSYAIYLTHKGIIKSTHKLLVNFELNENLMLLICIVFCIIGAYILNLLIEKPFMKLRNKLID